MRDSIIALCLVFLITSCAKQYVAPTGVPTATISLSANLENNYGAWVLVQNFESISCSPSPNGNRLASFGTTKVQGKGDPKDGVTKSIAAGRPFVFSYIYQTGAAGFTDTTTCIVTQSFIPDPGVMYKASFIKSADRCYVSVTEDVGSEQKPVGSIKLVKPSCFNKLNG